MKKGNLTGWRDVYRFTIAQNIKNKTYVCSTIIVTLLIAVALVCLNVLPSVISDKKEDSAPKTDGIQEVCIVDQSGLPELDWTQMQTLDDNYKNTKFYTEPDAQSVRDELDHSETTTVLVEIRKAASGYQVEVVKPASKKIPDNDGYALANFVSMYFRNAQAAGMEVTKEQISFIDIPVNQSVAVVGEPIKEDNFFFKFVQYFINIGLFVVFVMLIEAYAKMTATVVAMEKSSKVIELILTSIRPYATMVGKIVAMLTLIIGQFILWIAVGFIAFFGSNRILFMINPKYNNKLLEVFDMLKSKGFSVEFNLGAIVVALLVMITGIAVYITIAAFMGACVGKIEELAQSLQGFAIVLLVGAYIPLFSNIATLQGGGGMSGLTTLATYLPICSLYVVPTGLILGTISFTTAFISLGITIATLCVLFAIIGKAYGAVILHSGTRLKIKDVIAMSKSK